MGPTGCEDMPKLCITKCYKYCNGNGYFNKTVNKYINNKYHQRVSSSVQSEVPWITKLSVLVILSLAGVSMYLFSKCCFTSSHPAIPGDSPGVAAALAVPLGPGSAVAADMAC